MSKQCCLDIKRKFLTTCNAEQSTPFQVIPLVLITQSCGAQCSGICCDSGLEQDKWNFGSRFYNWIGFRSKQFSLDFYSNIDWFNCFPQVVSSCHQSINITFSFGVSETMNGWFHMKRLFLCFFLVLTTGSNKKFGKVSITKKDIIAIKRCLNKL